MILGSGGLVGRSLTEKLKELRYNIIEIKGRQHIDLREEGCLDIFNNVNISFIYFLACEVGGSKFLSKSGEIQKLIWDSNEKMYKVVFEWIKKRNIPFIFSSSQLSNQPTNYGKIKKRGEEIVEKESNGKIVMFWNVYGPEDIGVKSHVISDWIYSCLTKKKVDSLTDGKEVRQYLHTEDCSLGLISMMENFNTIEKIVHLTTGVWSSLHDIANYIEEIIPLCKINFSNKIASSTKGQEPNLNTPFFQKWKPKLSLSKNFKKIII
jgi:nucleoside-diphosphate-sugar epimerase